MASLRIAASLLALANATLSKAETVESWRSYIQEASLRFGVPTPWIERVMRAESNGHSALNGHPIRSRAGAMGLMQIMPNTWEMLRQTLVLGSDPDNPHDNILAGTFYLRMMYDRFGYPGLFDAYDAGPTRFAAYLAHGRPLPIETISYLQEVSAQTRTRPIRIQTAMSDTLFAVQNPHRAAARSNASRLFAVQND